MTDGLFEVTLVKMPRNLIEINDIIQYMSQANPHSELVYQFKASHVVLESEEVIRWTLDGEYGGAYDQVELLNQQKKMQIIVPSSKY
jgi:diacylglycerol kinase family enzyme